MISIIGWTAFFISIVFDVGKYFRQIQKLLSTRCSKDISSTSWYFAVTKDVFAIIACVCLNNVVGALLASVGLIMCVTTLALIIKYKPAEWKKESILCKYSPSRIEFWE